MRAEELVFPKTAEQTMQQDVARCNETIARVDNILEQTRSDLKRTRSEVTRYQEQQETHVRRTWVLWAIVALLVGSVAGIGWFGSPLIQEHKGLLSQLPSMQNALGTIGTRISSAEAAINTWANDRTAMTDRMANIEKSVSSNLKVARNEARALAQGVKDQVGQSIQAIQSRLTSVESTQREAHEEVAKLQGQVTTLQRELTGVRQENAAQLNQLNQFQQLQQLQQQAHESTQNQMAKMDTRITANQNRGDALAFQVDRQRTNFEVTKGKTTEVSPGIYLTIKQTDVGRQRIEGWLQITSDGRIVWLRGEGAQHPISFSSQSDERPYQIVFTRISESGAAGYLQVPTAAKATVAEK